MISDRKKSFNGKSFAIGLVGFCAIGLMAGALLYGAKQDESERQSTETHSVEASVNLSVSEVDIRMHQVYDSLNQRSAGFMAVDSISCTVDGYQFSTSTITGISPPKFLSTFTRRTSFTRLSDTTFLLDGLGDVVMESLKLSTPKPLFLSEMGKFLTDSAALCVEGAKKEIEIKNTWLS